jgi:kynurenine 3-monooxygenase
MLIALPNFDGTFTCTLFLPFQGPESFETLNSREAVDRFFQAYFPDARALIENLTDTFFTNPTGQMVTVKTSHWNLSGKALLLGDAAHAIVPFFGQGMNCGFEDLSVFDRMLSQSHPTHPIDWQKLFSDFSLQRKPDADCIADLAVENFSEMRDKVADPEFLADKKIEAILQREFPDDYVSRYSMVSFSRIPYRWAVAAGKVHARILSELRRTRSSPEDIHLPTAKRLIEAELAPVMKKAQEDLKKWT